MKNATLTVAFNAEKLDALVFHMGKKEADLQEELNETVQRLYEKYVPQATREYITIKWRATELEERQPAGQRGLRHTEQGLSEAKIHRPRKWKSTFRPCEALCAPVSAFVNGSGIRVPLRRFFTALDACEGWLGEGSIYAPGTRKYGRKDGSKSVQVKGVMLL